MRSRYMGFVEELKRTFENILEGEISKIEFRHKGEELAESGDRLIIFFNKEENKQSCCGLHIREIFEDSFMKSVSMPEIVEEIIGEIHARPDLSKITGWLCSYENAKEHLIIRAIDHERYQEELADKVYKKIEGIAMVVYLLIEEKEGCVVSTKLKKETVWNWGNVSEEEVYEQAMNNTMERTEPRVLSIMQFLLDQNYKGEVFMDTEERSTIWDENDMYCISSDAKTNGAVTMFLPGVAKKVAELVEDDLFINLTSVHEAMIHPVTGSDPIVLQRVLSNTIQSATEQEEILTESLYYYSKADDRFFVYGGEEYLKYNNKNIATA